ncbi:MAG: M1 family metallopeptidase [Gemmatimonadales bacterium]
MRFLPCLTVLTLLPTIVAAQSPDAIARADSLRGFNTPERAWWDVSYYDLSVKVNPADSTVRGVNRITYRVKDAGRTMQIDLQSPLLVDSFVQQGKRLSYRRDGNAWLVNLEAAQPAGGTGVLAVYYSGRPHVAKRAPWDGGIVWASDSLGRTVIATACQGTGASIWWPTKDTQMDEPDSQRVVVTVPDPLINVSNGQLRSTTKNPDQTTSYEWFISEPINNYDIAINAANYARLSDVYDGAAGKLSLTYWPLDYHRDAAAKQFAQVKSMLACFEKWFGPYPWYKDGYQLVETPHLGMEHQSGIAYGNRYLNGYLGRDLSGTGQGSDWDFIIVHESAHEWWGNSITTADLADMWVHEGFGAYSEGIYVECLRGREAGAQYIVGTRRSIRNDRPITPEYGRNQEGSGDMYPKGANMLHTIRQVINDDEKWKGILRGLQSTFRHQVVTAAQVEQYISSQSGIDFTRVFQQYLTTTQIPVFDYRLDGSTLAYRWTGAVPGFDLPVKVMLGSAWVALKPTSEWQTVKLDRPQESVTVDQNYYVLTRRETSATP